LPENKSVPQIASELWTLTKDYARQETVEPLKGIGRYLAYGFAGVVIGSVGVIMLLLAMLRALQTETGSTFHGSWSWAPYALVLLAASLLGALAASRIGKRN
jgi:uncharacterized integral membrane protein